MKFILVVADDEYLRGKMYVFEVLAECFRKHGHQFDWLKLDQYYKVPVKKIDSYDVLIVNNARIKSPKIHSLVKPFLKKKMITFKTGTNTEMIDMHSGFNYGIPTDYFLGSGHIPCYRARLLFLTHPKHFTCPIYTAYQIPKPNVLSKAEFYRKYQIPSDQKLAIFLPGMLDKLISLHKKKPSGEWSKFDNKVTWVLDHVDYLQQILKENGYTMLIKNHTRDERRYRENKRPKLTKDLANCLKFELDDGYEAVHYSDFAITIGTTIVYELYLYDLPTLELATGKYLYRWSHFLTTPKAQQYYKKYHNGEDLIFGKICNDQEFEHLTETIGSFIQNLPQIEDFPYRDHHPIQGETYHNSVENMYQIIMNHL